MKKIKNLCPIFLTKEKLLITFLIFILINISISVVFRSSIYSYDGYIENYPNAGLEFFYYLHGIGITPFLFMLIMLLLPNLVSYDVLNLQQSHASYLIETRISKKSYYLRMFIINILISALIVFILELLILLVIHVFYAPIRFHTMEYPDFYYRKTQILSTCEPISLLGFITLTSIGYAMTSSFVFSMQIFITNKYIYRCFGVIFGILLVLVPALIQGYLPIPEAAFILQINNITALGMENVRANPFGLSHIALYSCCLSIYTFISILGYRFLLKWRQHYD